ncbi:MAG: hypothetical protein LBI14_05215 [Treponema sp.]|jgi:cytoskeletal protein CcmA (bactofilin family)|nr:hypothetical protein [Treponema sp.]
MSEEKRKLAVNCGLACLLNDREGVLDNYDRLTINCGTMILSSAINAKLGAKGAAINCGDMMIKDIKGEVIQLNKGAVIDGNSNLKDLFVIAMDNLLIKKDGIKALDEVEGIIALGKIYYPESAGLASLIKVSGEKKAYPDDAHVILGDQKMEDLIFINQKGDKKHFWISKRLTALDKEALESARSQGLTISCAKFFSYEGLNKEYGSMINCADRTLVPDGFEIVDKIREGELGLHGKKLYVNGDFTMNENDIPALEELESVIVKGKASLPASAVKVFRNKGKADEYFVFEGRFIKINGFEQFSHGKLETSVKQGQKLTLHVNGCLQIDDDVTPEDIECIASLTYNGTVLVSDPAKSALAQKVKEGNGFLGDSATLEKMTGKSVKDLINGNSNGDSKGTTINMGTYILV